MTPSGYKMGALVNIYAGDGTVEVSHSGSELGQGINTKVRAFFVEFLCARAHSSVAVHACSRTL